MSESSAEYSVPGAWYPEGNGGNSTIVNTNEYEMLESTIAQTPTVYAPGSDIDYSDTVGVFRRNYTPEVGGDESGEY